jgi:hypothetical protein
MKLTDTIFQDTTWDSNLFQETENHKKEHSSVQSE